MENNTNHAKYSFVQITKKGLTNILKIHDAFPSLSEKKILEIHELAFGLPKWYITNMTTKRPSRKYVLIPMNETNKNSLLYHTDVYTNIINNYLKTIKLEISVTVVL